MPKLIFQIRRNLNVFLVYFYQVNLLKEKYFFSKFSFNRLVYLLFTPTLYFFQFYYFFLNIWPIQVLPKFIALRHVLQFIRD